MCLNLRESEPNIKKAFCKAKMRALLRHSSQKDTQNDSRHRRHRPLKMLQIFYTLFLHKKNIKGQNK